MKKIVKRIAAIAVISSTVMSLMASASALTNSETVTNTTKIGTTSYTTKGTNDISTTRYSFVIDLSTYVSSPSSATANEIHTHWQVYDYWTGADIGTKQTEDGYNTNRKDGYDCVSRTYYDDITVLCAHTAYKNGQTIKIFCIIIVCYNHCNSFYNVRLRYAGVIRQLYTRPV